MPDLHAGEPCAPASPLGTPQDSCEEVPRQTDKSARANVHTGEVVLDCGCVQWRYRATMGDKAGCAKHSRYMGPHPEDGLDVVAADRTVVAMGKADA